MAVTGARDIIAEWGKVDLAFPVLPSQDIGETEAFYAQLGFVTRGRWDELGYLIIRRETIELHFFSNPALDRFRSDHGCYLRVGNIADFNALLVAMRLPAEGVPRFHPQEDKPWGMRECALVDPDGNLLRFGQDMDA
jgi:catechol 2,3-dioxygenase-like lactoylglutathione lyase family enzyme